MTRSLLVVALLALLAGSALADDSKANAKKHVDAAMTLYAHSHWHDALEELNVAYTLDPQPDLLFAIAQLHVKLGDCDGAIQFYTRFIATNPAHAKEAQAKQAIEICKTNPPPPEPEGQSGKPEPPKPEPPKPEPPKPEPPRPVVVVAPTSHDSPWYSDGVGDALVGGGVAATVVAALLYRSALSDLDPATNYPTQASTYSSARTLRTASIVTGAGGLALIGVGVWHYMSRSREPQPIAITPAPHGGVVSWSISF